MTVVLKLDTYGLEIKNWTSYTFATSFLDAADGFSFTIGDPSLPHVVPDDVSGIREIREGLKVSLRVDDQTICTGFIDEVHYEATRDGGTIMTVTGRDVLGDAIDATMDPALVFHPTQTLAQIIQTTMTPYGFLNEPIADNDANRDIITGNKYGYKVHHSSGDGTRLRRRGKSKAKASGKLKSPTSHQSKAGVQEGVYAFCERLANRAGLHVWATADGVDLVVGKPQYDQDARYSLVRRRGAKGGANNILSGSVTKSRKNQPSLIIAGGVGGGQDVHRATLKTIMINELVARNTDGTLVPSVHEIVEKYPTAYVIGADDIDGDIERHALNPYPRVRPLFLYDPEARNLEQLINFTIREMTERQKGALTLSYEVDGHTQNGTVWAIDTIVHVDDEVGQVEGEFYISAVTFTKSRTGGEKTHLTLVRPYSIAF